MKHPKYLGCLLSLFFVYLNGSAQTEYFVQVFPSTGQHVRIDSIPGVKTIQIGPSCSTVDKVFNRYFFKGMDANNAAFLYAINIANGSVLSKVPLPNTMSGLTNLGGFEFDDSLGVVISLAWEPVQQMEYLVSIHPGTGIVTPISLIPGPKSIVIGSCTYDQKYHRYFFIGDDSLGSKCLYTMSALTGAIQYKPNVTTATLMVPRFNSVTQSMYAFNSSSNPMTLSKVNITTGAAITSYPLVGVGNGISQFPNYESIDELNNRYTFYNSSAGMLRTVNLANPSTYTQVPFPVGIIFGDNVIELRYQNASGQLWGLHWGKLNTPVTVGVGEQEANALFSLHPNPVSTGSGINVKVNTDGRLRIADLRGRVVVERECQAGQDFQMDMELAKGVYLVSLLKGNFIYSEKKLVVE